MSLTHIYMYNNNSESGNEIAQRLGLLRINHTNSNFKARLDRIVLNWGGSDLPLEVRRCNVINNEQAVYRAVNKIPCLQVLSDRGVSTPEFTFDREQVLEWLDAGHGVYARTKLTGHDGDGCVYMDPESNTFVRNARLYTKALPIDHEFRVTMLNGVVIGCQHKVPDGTRFEADLHIRTTAGGWGFRPCQNQNTIRSLTEVARSALEALDLNFGGVDIVKSGGEYYVLEVNTAPVMTPYVMDNFINELRDTYIDG